MNEAEAAATILEDVANSQVIMMEVLVYGVASIVLILLMDLFAAKAIGDRQSMEYKILKIPRFVSIFIVCMFTVIIGVICLYNDQFSVTRSTAFTERLWEAGKYLHRSFTSNSTCFSTICSLLHEHAAAPWDG